MKVNGEYKGLSRDLEGNLIISFAIDDNNYIIENAPKLVDKELEIEFKKYSPVHSHNQRKYFHELVRQLAPRVNLSFHRCKNMLLFRYGQPMTLPNGDSVIIKTNIPSDAALEDAINHMMPIKYDEDATWYKLYKGTALLSVEEYTQLIEGTVNECREQGIQTDTPAELSRLKELWKSAKV